MSTKRPPDEGTSSLNANEVLMLHNKVKSIQTGSAQTNKIPLEAEKARDEFHNQIQQIEEHLQPSTSYCFSMQGNHVMFFFYVSWCTEALCEEVI